MTKTKILQKIGRWGGGHILPLEHNKILVPLTALNWKNKFGVLLNEL